LIPTGKYTSCTVVLKATPASIMMRTVVHLPFASWENYCVWKSLALRQPNSAWLGLGGALANMLQMRSESAEVPLNAGAKPNAQAQGQGKANPNPHHANQSGLASLGFGKGIGSRPTLHDHLCLPPSLRFAFCAVGGGSNARRHKNDEGEEFSGPLVAARKALLATRTCYDQTES